MRIIAGEFRGRTILSPPTDGTTRPITDRVKQSVFDVLSPLLADAAVFDVFAGTGSLGLEAISRGCRRATFFEADRSAQALLRKNIAALKVENRAKVVSGDLFEWFGDGRNAAGEVDVLFLDPPYRFLRERANDLKKLATQISEKYLAANGVVIFRHDAADELDLPGLNVVDARSYGSMRVEFLRARI
jgi:16S rRNA (guanine966-N2)-methyltransferase